MGRGLQGKSMIDVNSASDPFDFDADPNPDQGYVLEQNGSKSKL